MEGLSEPGSKGPPWPDREQRDMLNRVALRHEILGVPAVAGPGRARRVRQTVTPCRRSDNSIGDDTVRPTLDAGRRPMRPSSDGLESLTAVHSACRLHTPSPQYHSITMRRRVYSERCVDGAPGRCFCGRCGADGRLDFRGLRPAGFGEPTGYQASVERKRSPRLDE